MNDEDIKKALECCSSNMLSKCVGCKISKTGCQEYLASQALDLINRQQAEIDRLKSLCTSKDVIIKEQEAEIEQLKGNLKFVRGTVERLNKQNDILSKNADTAFQDGLNEAQEVYAEQIKSEVKSEAIKEFAERLRLQVIKTRFDAMYGAVIEISNDTITEIVKEMVGGENA